MISKQDRVKPRTVEDLERMYNFKATKANVAASAEAARAAASAAEQSATAAGRGLEDKIDKTDDAQIIEMINRSTDVIKLLLNRLVIESTNFKLSEDGKVEMSDATVKSTRGDYNYPVSTEIKEGTIVLEPDYNIVSDGAFIVFELLRFKYNEDTYALQMTTEWVEDASGTGLRLVLDNLGIEKLE